LGFTLDGRVKPGHDSEAEASKLARMVVEPRHRRSLNLARLGMLATKNARIRKWIIMRAIEAQ
jgi:hypothetical protein